MLEFIIYVSKTCIPSALPTLWIWKDIIVPSSNLVEIETKNKLK